MNDFEKLKIPYPVIVEGKYDKITLSSVLDAHIIVLGGFSVFNAKEKQVLLRRLAMASGVIVLTDLMERQVAIEGTLEMANLVDGVAVVKEAAV